MAMTGCLFSSSQFHMLSLAGTQIYYSMWRADWLKEFTVTYSFNEALDCCFICWIWIILNSLNPTPPFQRKDIFISGMYNNVSHPCGLCWDLIPCFKVLAWAKAHGGSEFPILEDMDIPHTHTQYFPTQTSTH